MKNSQGVCIIIKSNKPDTVVKDFKRKTCLQIDMSVPTDNDFSAKEYNKISKYKDFEREIEKNCGTLKLSPPAKSRGTLGYNQERDRQTH